MGDRGNIVVHMDGDYPPVYIYTHWHGSELPTLLAKALDTKQAQSRLGDAPYLTRIVFCQIMKQVDDLDGETGWGISTYECDNNYPLIHLYADSSEVEIEGEPRRSVHEFLQDQLGHHQDVL